MGKTKISSSLKENETYIRERCRNCADILIRPMRLGTVGKTDCLMVYIEVAVSNMMLDDSAPVSYTHLDVYKRQAKGRTDIMRYA